jgi:LacI family gluconate utilization system Gnt-I transcriptional repressor
MSEAGIRVQPESARRRQGATLSEVAQAAGVSTATVSRALNHPNLVSADTLSRVHAAIAETGYIPALSTGTVISNRSRLIGIMVPPSSLGLSDSTVRAAVAELEIDGYQALLGIYSRTATREQLVTQIFSRRPSGLIVIGMPLLPGIRDLMIESGLPIVETWEMPRVPIDMVAGISHHDIGIAIGNFLLAKGYRNPFILSGDSARGLIRRYGITRVLVEAGLKEPRSVEFALPGTVGEGRRALRELIAAGERPDVIVCASDWLAQGVTIEAAVQGIKVPDELGVIGFGDFDFAAELEPALTTVRIDGAEMGRRAAAMMLKALRGERQRDKVVDIGFELVERASA